MRNTTLIVALTKNILPILLAGVFLVISTGCFGNLQQAGNQKEEVDRNEKVVMAKPDPSNAIEISLDDLDSRFLENQPAFNSTFLNKTLRLSALVDSVEENEGLLTTDLDFLSKTTRLSVDRFPKARCHFSSEPEIRRGVETLKTGHGAEILGVLIKAAPLFPGASTFEYELHGCVVEFVFSPYIPTPSPTRTPILDY